MENASKALIIAGSVLIAILIIAVLVKSYSNISIYQRNKLTEEEQEQLEAFNEQYTKYAGQYVYGTEVITTINKIKQSEYPIKVIIQFADEYTYTKKEYENGKKVDKTVTIKAGKELTITNEDDEYTGTSFIEKGSRAYGNVETDKDGNTTVTGINNKAFKCTEIKYDNSTGRVNSIKFVEKKYGNLN